MKRGKRKNETYASALARAEGDVERWAARVCVAASRLAEARSRVRRYRGKLDAPAVPVVPVVPEPRTDDRTASARAAVEGEIAKLGEELDPDATERCRECHEQYCDAHDEGDPVHRACLRAPKNRRDTRACANARPPKAEQPETEREW